MQLTKFSKLKSIHIREKNTTANKPGTNNIYEPVNIGTNKLRKKLTKDRLIDG